MAAPASSEALPSLAPDWTAANLAVCPNLNTNDYWIYDYGSSTVPTVLGGPSQTSNGCLPSGWTPQVTYVADDCPSGFTSLTLDGSTLGQAYTCCPTAYRFTGNPGASTDRHYSTFRCQSQYAAPYVTAAVIYWTVQQPEASTTTATRALGENKATNHLYAFAVLYTTPATTSSASSSSSPSTPSNESEKAHSALSVAASAGIGVGIGIGVLMIALLGWFCYRRRISRRRYNHPFKTDVKLAPVSGIGAGQDEAGVTVNNTVGRSRMSELPENTVQELQGDGPR